MILHFQFIVDEEDMPDITPIQIEEEVKRILQTNALMFGRDIVYDWAKNIEVNPV